MNVMFIAGTVGSDPELRTMPTGKPVLNFKVVVDVGWGDKKHALWIDCGLYGERATKLAPYLGKGSKVSVYGTFDLRTYQTKNGPGAAISCSVDDLQLQGGNTQRKEKAPAGAFDDKAAADVAFEDDIPF